MAFYHQANSDGSVGAGWFIDDVSLSQATPTRLAVNAPSNQQFTTNRQNQYFVVTAPSGGHLRIRLNDLDHLGINELYVRRGALPTAGSYDYRFPVNGSADQSILVPNADAGDWFILAYNAAGPVPGDYTLTAQFFTGVVLDSLAPASLGNSIPGTVMINGAGFPPDSTVALVNGVNVFPATDVAVVSASQIEADFDFTSIPTNTYFLRVTSGTNSDSLPFVVVNGGEARLETHLIVPRNVGRHAPATIYIQYANVGNVAMPAPLLVLTGTQKPILRMALGLVPVDYQQGFWTSANPAGWSQTIQFLASGNTPGILQPGESNTIPVAYAGLLEPWDFFQNSVRFDLGVMTITNTTPVDWNSFKATMKPASIPNDAWNALWANFTADAGATWGDYVRLLNRNATYLRKLGLDVKDLNGLLAFAFAQADSLNVVRTLASSTDAYVPTPGLRLGFERFFPQSISGRHRTGALGRGWSHSWEISLTEAFDVPDHPAQPGTVTITGPGGSRRVFQPDRRTSGTTYFSKPGDHGTLIKFGAIFTLTEPRGLKLVFAADGKLTYVEDPNGNRITTTFSGNLLTKLTHSAGQSLTLNYSGGVLQYIADSVGRTNTFSYDGAQHLKTVAYYDGASVTNSYAIGQGAAREHALTQVAYSAGTHEFFDYDANGRLFTLNRDGGSEALTFRYEGTALVGVTDAFTNKTRFYLDNRGLLAKVENPFKNTLRLNYDAEFNLSSLTDPAGRSHQYGYDSIGNLTDSTDPLGARTRFNYGPLNRLATLTDAKNNPTRYTHDAKGNLNAITYADNSVENWGYDTVGNATTWTNRRRQTIEYHYNAFGQLTNKTYPDLSDADYAYDQRGNLTNAVNYLGAISLTYYDTDRLKRITYPGNRWLEYTYDDGGRRKTMADQLGYTLYYNYDPAGRLRELTNNAGTPLVLYEYDEAGRLWRKTLGNGVYTTNAFDAAGQLLALVNRKPDGTLLSRFNYAYDSRGRRTTNDTHFGTWTYRYDDLGQLTNAVLVSTDINIPSQNLTYIYDALGNRVRTIENGVTTDYTANNLNQYTQVGAMMLKYDADGSLTQKVVGVTTLLSVTNNSENRVVGSSSTNGTQTFDYDALGFSAIVRSGSVPSYQVHDPAELEDLVTTYDDLGALNVRLDHGFGAIGSTTAASRSFLTFDPVGNVSDLTDEAGLLSNSHVFRPFGEKIRPSGGQPGSLGFEGEYGTATQQGGLISMRTRFYASDVGRFISQDPIGLAGGDLNFYSFVGNNPIHYVDPAGLEKKQAGPIGFDKEAFVKTAKRPIWQYLKFKNPWAELGRVADKFRNIMDRFREPGEKLVNYNPFEDQDIERGSWESVQPIITEFLKVPIELQPGGDIVTTIVTPPNPPADPSNTGSTQTAQANDPNALTGPAGYGQQNYIAGDSLFAYRIDFENASNATAPAQVVIVSNPLSNTLDLATLQLTEIAFGNSFITIPPGSQHYANTIHLTSSNGFKFDLQIDVGLNLSNGVVYANFNSINPTNGLPPPVTVGFLQPAEANPTKHTGLSDAHISYTIRPKPALSTDTKIRNVAFITFDPTAGGQTFRTDLIDPTNPNSGINTNRQALVTIDATPPSSTVTGPSGTATNSSFTVTWSGSDIGSGVTSHDIYSQTNGGPWGLWLSGATGNFATFFGQNGKAYGFFSVAHDGAGNVETTPSSPDTTAVTQPNYPPVIDAVSNRVILVGQQLSVTNHAADPDSPILFSLGSSAPTGASITTNGILQWTPVCIQGSTTNLITVWAVDSGSPRMSNSVTFIVTVPECIEASLGNTVLLAGSTSSVPVRLLSTTALTNMAFTMVYPADRFTTNFTLTVNSPEVITQQLRLLAAGNLEVSFTLSASNALHGPTNIGQLGLTAVSNQSSAFVMLAISNVVGLKPDGNIVGNAYGLPGRVVVIGPEPLLEAFRTTNNDVGIILYAIPGSTNEILSNPVLSATGSWTNFTTIALTNLFEVIEVKDATNGMRFFRALRR